MNDEVGAAEDRRKHLEFLQAVISRMSSASGVAKGWCLTVTTAALGYALTKRSDSVAVLAVAACLLFGSLDARYLREERKFRSLYNRARAGTVAVFDMSTAGCTERKSQFFDPMCGWGQVLKSWSIWTFYGPIVLLGLAALLRIRGAI